MTEWQFLGKYFLDPVGDIEMTGGTGGEGAEAHLKCHNIVGGAWFLIYNRELYLCILHLPLMMAGQS